jgi:1,4-alpha-glucan branching enzyme
MLAVVLNFTPVPRHDYRVPAPPGAWVEIFNSDAGHYGGSGLLNREWIQAEHHAFGGRDHSLVITLPPLGGVVLLKAG